jgi:GNAT superfamily N-acetyltransferase
MGEPAELTLAGVDDLADLARLRWNWQLAQGEVPQMDEAAFVERFSAWASERSRTHVAYLVRRAGQPLGMAWLVVTERLPGPGRWDRANAYIATLYVEPDARGDGIGTRLISALIDEARRRGVDILQVHPSDQAMDLYRRLGFIDHPGSLDLSLTGGGSADPTS